LPPLHRLGSQLSDQEWQAIAKADEQLKDESAEEETEEAKHRVDLVPDRLVHLVRVQNPAHAHVDRGDFREEEHHRENHREVHEHERAVGGHGRDHVVRVHLLVEVGCPSHPKN